jgi:hypothetical protein
MVKLNYRGFGSFGSFGISASFGSFGSFGISAFLSDFAKPVSAVSQFRHGETP